VTAAHRLRPAPGSALRCLLAAGVLRCLLAAGVLGTLLLAGAPAPAGATPLGDARQRAAQLRTEVDALRQQAEIATEDYDAAYAQLGQAVTAHLTAEHDLEAARTAAGSTDDTAARRARALYTGGGITGLYAAVLDSTTIGEVAARVHRVDLVLGADRRAAAKARNALALQQDATRRLSAAADASTRLQKAVAEKADRVRSLLARADLLLSQADAEVVQLAEEQRRAAEAAAAARAARLLAQAQQQAQQAQYSGPDLPPVSASPLAAAALDFARQQLGKPYVWGATGPGAYDCSGLTGAAYRAAGLSLPRTSREQWYAGPHVALADLEPGDLLFWGYDPANPATIHHVALYAGNGMMVAAPHSGDVVKVQPIYLDGYVGAVRPGVT
jgi:cell wall-associated NlpC family hydrolase